MLNIKYKKIKKNLTIQVTCIILKRLIMKWREIEEFVGFFEYFIIFIVNSTNRGIFIRIFGLRIIGLEERPGTGLFKSENT